MRGAVPCPSADLTTHAVKTLYPAGFQNGEAPRRAKRCGDERCKRRRCARVLGLTLSWLDRREAMRCGDGRCKRRRFARIAVMSDVSGDAVRGFLAWLFPGLIVARLSAAVMSDVSEDAVRGFLA